MKPLLAATIVLVVTGCASTPPVNYATMDPAGIAAATTVHGSKFSKVTTIEGPAIRARVLRQKSEVSAFDQYDNRMVLLRAIKASGVPTNHQAYVEIEYDGASWRFYQRASAVGGDRLVALPIDRKVVYCGTSGCTYRETIGVDLRESDVHGKGDIEFALKTKAGDEDVIRVPRNYVDGYLTVVNR